LSAKQVAAVRFRLSARNNSIRISSEAEQGAVNSKVVGSIPAFGATPVYIGVCRQIRYRFLISSIGRAAQNRGVSYRFESGIKSACAWILGTATQGVVRMLLELGVVPWKVVPRQPGSTHRQVSYRSVPEWPKGSAC
jgi:hypothetical protein